jgi:DNA polymerase-2
MTARGFILQPTYRIDQQRPVVQLYGRLEDGRAFLVEDDRFRPYLFARKSDVESFAKLHTAECSDSDLCDFAGNAVARITVRLPAELPALRERLERDGIETFESDIRFQYRFLIDHQIRASIEIEGSEEESSGLVRYRNPTLGHASFRPSHAPLLGTPLLRTPLLRTPLLRTLSIDLETTPTASEIFSAALATSDGTEEVHLVYATPVAGAIVHPDERQMLAAVNERIRLLDPDIITGWNVVDFDLRTWTKRCSALGIGCQIGRTPGRVNFADDSSFTRQSRAVIAGRMVLDGIPLVRDAIRLDDYRLETAAQSLLGRGKLIDKQVPDAAAEIGRLYRDEPEALVRYNLEDARLVLEILEHEHLLDLAVERSMLCGMQLDRVGASIASFDLLYLPELRRRGIVAPCVNAAKKVAMVRGGALLDPRPGLFQNVAVFDFKSLYPSLIRTFNLDPLAHARGGRDGAAELINAPNGAAFSRDDAILPAIIERFTERRDDAKKRGDRNADQAIKIMMNAMFGVLGAASCRFFDPAVANAITGFGQQILYWTRDEFERAGVDVLYGDTDSVFVQLSTTGHGAAARAEAEKLRDSVGERIASRIRDEYRVESKLLLELERVYDRLFLPTVRGGSTGSKKRYAGWIDGELEVIGLESVRRDWPVIARRLQRGMLERMFQNQPVVPFVTDVVEKTRAGVFDSELVYTKRLRKGSVDRYTASAPPHIQAARKAGAQVGRTVRYLVTSTGPEPVLADRDLPTGIDRRHYVDRVLRPIAEAILSHIGRDFDEVLGEPHQLDLFPQTRGHARTDNDQRQQ